MKKLLAFVLLFGLSSGCLSPITSRLDAVNQQLAVTNQQLNAVSTKLDELNQKFSATNIKLDGVEQLAGRMELAAADENWTSQTETGLSIKSQGTTASDDLAQRLNTTNSHLQQVEKDLKSTSDTIKKMDEKIPRIPKIP